MIIGLCGLAGSGKDTVADFLVKDHDFVKVACADPLKRICRDVFGFTDEQLWGSSQFRNEPDRRYPRNDRYIYPATPVGALWLPVGGGRTLINEDDLELILAHKWRVNTKEAGKKTAYIRRTDDSLKLHQLLMGAAPEGQVIDHTNGDGCDNRRVNLRFCTHSENHANESKRRGGTSPFKGVCFNASRKKWQAALTVYGETRALGRFDREEDAAMAYDRAAMEVFGSHARTNAALFLTPRYALQQLGTNWGRDCFGNTWIDYALRVADQLKEGLYYYDVKTGVRFLTHAMAPSDWVKGKKDVVISDVRFLNELEAIKKKGGKVVRLRRGMGLEGAAGRHQSELEMGGMDDELFDYILDNREWSLEVLEREVADMHLALVLRREENE